jgi:UDP-2,3-diacylglucosamine pyrophosphatase LpxH
MNKIIIISDVHLGSNVCRTDKVLECLDIPCDKLIINGDLFDSFNLTRFNSKHWKVLSKIRKLSKKIPIVFCRGNHDGNIEFLSDLLGVQFVHDVELIWKNKKIFICHGDRFDHWMAKQMIADFFTGLYYFIQKFDTKERKFSTWLKLKSKQILKVHKNLENKAINFALANSYDVICVGHSHLENKVERDGIIYVNSGSFTEEPCSYIEIDEEIELKHL